jgi:D-alanyl-lipoteichoic acid acyltransferase DltB (MBOAT superfamily)
LVVFLVSGLWHGASWNFIVWGALHAAGFLMLMVLPGKASEYSEVVAANSRFPKFGELTGMLFTFSFVAFAWVFFRAPDLKVALDYLENMLRSLLLNPAANLHQIYGKSALLYILPLVMADWFFRHNERELKVPGKSRWARWLFYALLIFLIGMFKYADSSRFIYFQF